MSTLMHAPVLTGLFSSRSTNNRRSFVLLDDPLPPSGNHSQSEQSQGNADSNAPQEPRLRGIIGYHNAFHDGSADFDLDETENMVTRGLNRSAGLLSRFDGRESLPEYDCTILKHGPVSVKVERRSPFDFVQQPQWFEAYVVLRGTMLNVHHSKQAGIRPSRVDRIQDMAGKLIKSYTLQHAEAGLAADHKKVEMVPKNPVTSLLPEAAIEHLKITEPHLFEQKNIYVLRLRLETDQILLRFRSSEARASWLLNICAAIDLAPDIDRRTEPRFQTLPRRSRRRRDAPVQLNASMVEQQERIMREQFPNLAAPPTADGSTSTDARDADADDLDNSLVAVTQSTAIPRRRAPGRVLNTMSRFFEHRLSQHFSSDLNVLQLAASDPSAIAPTVEEEEDFAHDPDEKWNPGTVVDPIREARCIRRCMPTLLFNSRRANKLILKDGTLMVIDWNKKAMSPYTGQPPTYEETQAEVEPQTPDSTETPGFIDLFRQPTEQDENNHSTAATPQPTVSNPPVRPRSRSRRRPSLRPRTATRPTAEVDDSATSGSSGDDTPEPTSRKPGWLSKLRKVSSRPNLKSRPSEPIKQSTPEPPQTPINIQQHQYIHALKRRQDRPMSTYEIGDDAALRRMGLI